MANEISATLRLSASKSNLQVDRNPGTIRATMSGTRFESGVQDIGTGSHEALVVAAEFGTAGWGYFRNLDTTNFVQIGLDVAAAFVPFAKLLAGEAGIIPLATDALYAKADTGTVQLEYTLLER